MSNLKIGIRDVIKELDINKNKVEFTNDLNLFLNVIAFNESTKDYYDIVKEKFDDYMGKWELDIDISFSIISKYIKSRKLPYKIAKDEGFEQIKSEKFIISMLVELYAMKIIVENNENSKEEISKFIYGEFIKNGLNINEKDIILNDLDYLFKDVKLFLICRESLINRKEEINQSLNKTIGAIEKRKNIILNLNYKINFQENIDQYMKQESLQLKKRIEKLEKDVELNNILIAEYMDREIELQNEISKLQKYNIELIGYGQEQYAKALVDLVRNMNDSTNGNLLDRLYCYSKGYEEKSLIFVAKNLFNVLRQVGIYPRETIRIGENVSIEEYSFYNYRLNKDISDIKLCEGEVVYPAWFYNNKEILKPYVTIKGE
ncbi:hypothetical protein [Romboutsia sp.]|uniref:hypothetical protein n=1 Tax=Romboutsia sp. TaxID=1965302 RepID=UPI003F3864D1